MCVCSVCSGKVTDHRSRPLALRQLRPPSHVTSTAATRPTPLSAAHPDTYRLLATLVLVLGEPSPPLCGDGDDDDDADDADDGDDDDGDGDVVSLLVEVGVSNNTCIWS